MPDEIIICPSCNRKLRMAETHQGQIVQCPLCRVVFRTPVRAEVPANPPAAPAEGAPAAPATLAPRSAGQVTQAPAESAPVPSETGMPVIDVPRALLLPGLCLLISGVLSGIFQLVALRAHMALGPEGVLGLVGEMFSPDVVRSVQENMPAERFYGFVIFGDLLALFIAVGMALGAVQILRLGKYGLALFGSVLAFLNLASLGGMPCCFFTAPLGMWSLMVLRLPEVRAAFAAPPGPEEPAAGDDSQPS
ncbi:hypothetical protein AYO44_16060 [Planctomycetaceae bacterium SCGC AG-212-F19]|nr:hypothetical protein AYO44_16060 [Planctomycetaceae bacterium SCGC AG-212-F19]